MCVCGGGGEELACKSLVRCSNNKLKTHIFMEMVLNAAGSNSHNNGNPAGDGQAGDAGEGTTGQYFAP